MITQQPVYMLQIQPYINGILYSTLGNQRIRVKNVQVQPVGGGDASKRRNTSRADSIHE